MPQILPPSRPPDPSRPLGIDSASFPGATEASNTSPLTPTSSPPRRRGTAFWVAITSIVLVGGFVSLSLIGALLGPEVVTETRTITKASPIPGPTLTVTKEVPGPTVTVTETKTLPPPPPKTAISDGVWTVGVDIAPGTYRVIEAVVSECYWAIYQSGTNQEEIVANAIVEGGRPTVTLRKGQDFETGCGDWTKV